MPDKANPGLGITRIVADLRDLCERDATGIYFIVTDDRHQARIALVSGDIVFVAVGAIEGRQALARLATIRPIRVNFLERLRHHATATAELPSTADILDELERTASAAAPASGGGVPAPLSPAELALVRDALTHYLGPIAGLVLDEHRNGGQNIDAWLSKLALEITDSRKAAQFLAQVRAALHR